jgi:predicted small secreted protein
MYHKRNSRGTGELRDSLFRVKTNKVFHARILPRQNSLITVYAAKNGRMRIKMKKTIITIAAVLTLGATSLLASCTANTMTDGNSTDSGAQSATETANENNSGNNIVDDAESIIEDMSENATHGVDDGSFGGQSTRGDGRALFPRGK